jgi:hypothetical protein
MKKTNRRPRIKDPLILNNPDVLGYICAKCQGGLHKFCSAKGGKTKLGCVCPDKSHERR